jgi:hypothetical protein
MCRRLTSSNDNRGYSMRLDDEIVLAPLGDDQLYAFRQP